MLCTLRFFKRVSFVGYYIAPGSLRRLAAAAGRRSGVEGRYTGRLRGQVVCGGCLGPLTHQERAFNLARCGACLGAQVGRLGSSWYDLTAAAESCPLESLLQMALLLHTILRCGGTIFFT